MPVHIASNGLSPGLKHLGHVPPPWLVSIAQQELWTIAGLVRKLVASVSELQPHASTGKGCISTWLCAKTQEDRFFVCERVRQTGTQKFVAVDIHDC